MKGLSVAASLLAAVALALMPAVSTIYREAFPAEATKRAALAACVQADSGFRRLIAVERAKCYARQWQAPPQFDMVPRREEIVDSGTPDAGTPDALAF
jgi:hypothetical protein